MKLSFSSGSSPKPISAATKKRRPEFNFGIKEDIALFLENLGMLVSSGMGILAALESSRSETRSRRLKKIVDAIISDINSGFSLWRALDNRGVFSERTISLIRIGEETGRLSQNLNIISSDQEKSRIFFSKVRSAMLYPLFVLSLTLIIGLSIAIYILPKLALVFSQMHANLPAITKVLISSGIFLKKHGLTVIPAFAIAIFSFIYFIFYYPRTRFIGQFVLFGFSGSRSLIQEIELTRFGYLMSTLLEAGLTVTDAISALEKESIFYQYRRLYTHLCKEVGDGKSFDKSFASFKNSEKLIPFHIQQLIAAGERSGILQNAFLKVSEKFEQKSEQTTKNIAVLLEPILLVIVWLGVVIVALAVILPIYNLVGQFNSAR